MQGFHALFLLVACVLPAFTLAENVHALSKCSTLSEGLQSPVAWQNKYHQHLDATQYLRVIFPDSAVGYRVGSSLVACDDEAAPALELVNVGSGYLVLRSAPDNANGYINLLENMDNK